MHSILSVCVCVHICVYMCAFVCVRVFARDRERARERKLEIGSTQDCLIHNIRLFSQIRIEVRLPRSRQTKLFYSWPSHSKQRKTNISYSFFLELAISVHVGMLFTDWEVIGYPQDISIELVLCAELIIHIYFLLHHICPGWCRGRHTYAEVGGHHCLLCCSLWCHSCQLHHLLHKELHDTSLFHYHQWF